MGLYCELSEVNLQLLLAAVGALLLFEIVDILSEVNVPEVVSHFNLEVLVVVETGQHIACFANHYEIDYSCQIEIEAYSR